MSHRQHGRTRPRPLAIALAIATLATLVSTAAQATHIRYSPLAWQRLNLTSTQPGGLNDAGTAVGSAVTAFALQPQSAFIASGNTMNLSLLLGSPTYGVDINNAGQWAGQIFSTDTSRYRAVLRMDGVTQIIPGLGAGNSFSAALSNSAVVVGSMELAGNTRGFVWDGTSTQVIGTFGGTSSTARGINDRGQVVGSATNAGGLDRAFLWEGGQMVDLGTLGGNAAVATAINNQGVIVGASNLAPFGATQAYIRRGGTMQTLGTLGGVSNARGINDYSQVVGAAVDDGGITQAFVAGGEGMRNLNTLLATAPSVLDRLVTATDVNRQGQILARNAAGLSVLLTPEGTLTWTGRGDPSFTDAASWDSGIGLGPSRFVDMVLAHPASQTVDLALSAEVRSLVIGAAGGAGAGQLRLRLFNGATLSAEQGIVVERSGVLGGDGNIAADLQVRGTVQVGCVGCNQPARTFMDRSYRFEVQAGGLVTGSGLLEAGLTVLAGGEVRAGAGQDLRLLAPGGGAHTSSGVLEVRDGGRAEIGGLWTSNAGGGTVRLDDATVRFRDGLHNQGQVQIGFGGADLYGRIENRPGGRIIASGGNHTTFWDAVVNNGEVRASAGSQLVYFGPVSGAGSFTTNGVGAYHRFEGGYAPGNSPADVALGDIQLASLLTMELGGTTPGTQHDRIQFTGSLVLDVGAALEVVLIDGFQPLAGQQFDLFSFSQPPQGRFESVSLPGLAPGLAWDTSTLYTDGDLRVAAVPEPATWLLMALGSVLLWRRRGAA